LRRVPFLMLDFEKPSIALCRSMNGSKLWGFRSP
jgi:hypothetical protein